MADQSFLSGLVVIRRYDQVAVHRKISNSAGKIHCLGSRVRSSAGDNRQTPGRLLGSHANNLDMLFLGEGSRLAGGASNNQAVGFLLHMEVHQPPQAIEIDLSTGVHRCDKRHQAAAEHRPNQGKNRAAMVLAPFQGRKREHSRVSRYTPAAGLIWNRP